MHYGQIFKADTANGVGMRVSLFVSGCTNHCEGCFQPETWDFNYGLPYTKETEDLIVNEVAKPFYEGLTVLGGEPMEPENQEEVMKLVKRVRKEAPEKTIWIYSGFTYEKDLYKGCRKYTEFTDGILDNIDIMVDGKFVLAQKNITLNFRGSENQRIIDMKATREKGEVVLSPLND